MREFAGARLARLLVVGCVLWVLADGARAEDALTNLALKKKVTASTVEDGNPAEAATDGDEGTRWCASDGSAPQTVTIDLGGAKDIGGAEIRWEQENRTYQYALEGSADEKEWMLLNDQTDCGEKVQVHKLLAEGKGVRYVRLRIIGLEEGAWASLFEFKVYPADQIAKLSAEERKKWWAASQPNLAKGMPTTSSSDEDGHPSGDAVDGKADTRWCNNGPDAPAWLQVDLKKPSELSGCAILWEAAVNYKYKVEGSADAKEWKMLSDQTKTDSAKQSQKLTFAAKDIRYLKVTATELPEGSWASIFELKVFGKQ
jgi:hypothetical protein